MINLVYQFATRVLCKFGPTFIRPIEKHLTSILKSVSFIFHVKFICLLIQFHFTDGEFLTVGERDRYPSSHNRKDEESSFHRRERDVREVYHWIFFLLLDIMNPNYIVIAFVLVCIRIFGS